MFEVGAAAAGDEAGGSGVRYVLAGVSAEGERASGTLAEAVAEAGGGRHSGGEGGDGGMATTSQSFEGPTGGYETTGLRIKGGKPKSNMNAQTKKREMRLEVARPKGAENDTQQ